MERVEVRDGVVFLVDEERGDSERLLDLSSMEYNNFTTVGSDVILRESLAFFNEVPYLAKFSLGSVPVIDLILTWSLLIRYLMLGAYRNLRVLEVGNSFGVFSYCIGRALRIFSDDNTLVCLSGNGSNDQPGILGALNQNRLREEVLSYTGIDQASHIFTADPLVGLTFFANASFDIIFLNPPHAGLVEACLHKLRIGGLLIANSSNVPVGSPIGQVGAFHSKFGTVWSLTKSAVGPTESQPNGELTNIQRLTGLLRSKGSWEDVGVALSVMRVAELYANALSSRNREWLELKASTSRLKSRLIEMAASGRFWDASIRGDIEQWVEKFVCEAERLASCL